MDVDDLSSYEAEWDSQDPYARLVSEPHESDDEPSKEAAKGKAKPDAARSSTTSGTTTTRDSSALQPPSALLQRKKKKADSAPESGPGLTPTPKCGQISLLSYRAPHPWTCPPLPLLGFCQRARDPIGTSVVEARPLAVRMQGPLSLRAREPADQHNCQPPRAS